MIKGNVSFDGRSFYDFGIRAYCENPYEVAVPNIETKHIDGMNGDLHFYYGDYKNVNLTYLCIINEPEIFDRNFAGFRSWIYSSAGYKRLEDDRFPDEFRMASLLKGTKIGKIKDTFTITFSCKPQKYLKDGEQVASLDASGSIYNPTDYTALPLVRATGTGTIVIGDEALTITKNDDYTDIDCELMEAYKGTENLNANVTLDTGGFFTLPPGEDKITVSAGMTLDITPRWYQI